MKVLWRGPDFGPWVIDPSELPVFKEHPPSSGAGQTAEKFFYEPIFTKVLPTVTGTLFGM